MALEAYDVVKELQQFHSTKTGIKGLVDSGITKIPKLFVHPKEDLPDSLKFPPVTNFEVPIIDLNCVNDNHGRKKIIDKVYEASESLGFLQLINHGIPEYIMSAMLEGARAFHEGDSEIKSKLYTMDNSKKVRFFSNLLLYKSAYGTWRDSLYTNFDESFDFNEIPLSCRKAMIEYRENLLGLYRTICELLSEALGLKTNHLESINAAQKQVMYCHCYPPCPEPELTMGITEHKDASFLTILLQDSIGGLQVCYRGSWINVFPVRGALIVNIGDLLQLVSNGVFKSGVHRVLANNTNAPRVSVAAFLIPNLKENKFYGPIKELLSNKNPPIYRDILFRDYMKHYGTEGTKTDVLDNFKI